MEKQIGHKKKILIYAHERSQITYKGIKSDSLLTSERKPYGSEKYGVT